MLLVTELMRRSVWRHEKMEADGDSFSRAEGKEVADQSEGNEDHDNDDFTGKKEQVDTLQKHPSTNENEAEKPPSEAGDKFSEDNVVSDNYITGSPESDGGSDGLRKDEYDTLRKILEEEDDDDENSGEDANAIENGFASKLLHPTSVPNDNSSASGHLNAVSVEEGKKNFNILHMLLQIENRAEHG